MDTKDFAVMSIKSTTSWAEKKCFICGNYFIANEQLVLIVPSTEYKTKYKKKLGSNLVMHKEEFDRILKEVGGNKVDFLERMAKTSTPRKKREITMEQELNIQAFKRAAYKNGFGIENVVKNSIKMGKLGTSIKIVYNPYTNALSIEKRGKSGIFDRLLEIELLNRINNELGGV